MGAQAASVCTVSASSAATRVSRKGSTTARTGACSGFSTASTDGPGKMRNSDDAPTPCVCSAPGKTGTWLIACSWYYDKLVCHAALNAVVVQRSGKTQPAMAQLADDPSYAVHPEVH